MLRLSRNFGVQTHSMVPGSQKCHSFKSKFMYIERIFMYVSLYPNSAKKKNMVFMRIFWMSSWSSVIRHFVSKLWPLKVSKKMYSAVVGSRKVDQSALECLQQCVFVLITLLISSSVSKWRPFKLEVRQKT